MMKRKIPFSFEFGISWSLPDLNREPTGLRS